MESKYNYFKRDISWLSFNYRVLLEALDEHLPLYERINFISIYSSNLEEFYKIRVADHKAVASGATESDEETVQSARELVEEINHEVNRQLDDRVRIYEEKILPALRKNHIIFYQDRHVEPFHQQFIKDFFREEIFPYLQPVPVSKDKIVSFLRDNRLYLAIRLYPKENRNPANRQPFYFVMKQPYARVKDPSNYFYLVVRGDSMEPRIQDGDLALVHKQDTLENGDLGVLIYGDEGEGTLKRYIQRGNCVVLQPFNPAYHEMVIRGEDLNHLHIAGRVVETKAKW